MYTDRLLSISDVKQKTGMSHTWIYKQIKVDRFPKQRHLGPGTVRWLESEVDAWIKDLSSQPEEAA